MCVMRLKKASTTSNSVVGSVVNTVSDAANYVSETVQQYTAGASKEANKEVAKGHTDASLTDRASAGIDALGDKAKEEKHSAKAEGYSTSAKN
ncbi:hypothetical protein JCM3765_006169 [Sporobolomyces pararoseus]